MSIETSPFKAGQIWLGLYEFPGYLIGVHGEVVSTLKKTPRVLSPIRLGEYDGYQMRNRDGKLVKRYRHRLVAEAVFGPCPKGSVCRHLDGDKLNNDYTNLRWGTPKQNSDDKFAHGTAAVGERHGHAVLTEGDVRQMRDLRAAGKTFREIAERFSVSVMTAYRACTGKLWRTV